MPRRVIRNAHRADLSLAFEFFERTEGLVVGRHAIEVVHVVEIDIVGLQATQTRLKRCAQMLARTTAVGRFIPRAAAFRRQYNPLAVSRQPLAEYFLGRTAAVHIGGVK